MLARGQMSQDEPLAKIDHTERKRGQVKGESEVIVERSDRDLELLGLNVGEPEKLEVPKIDF